MLDNEAWEKIDQGNGMTPEDASALLLNGTDEDWRRIREAAVSVSRRFFGNRVHLFAPLYFSNICVNDCAYCGFKRSNRMTRQYLSTREFLAEARMLWDQGHRSILLVAAEHPVNSGALRIAKYLYALREQKLDFSIGIEVGPLSQSDYRDLAEMNVERCVLYQETYDREIYARVHTGPKSDYEWRYHALGRALAGGIRSVGVGLLTGLGDYRSEVPLLIRHAREFEARFGCAPATFSLPRPQPAGGTDPFLESFHPVDDETFIRLIALLKAALPKTGFVLTTRETPALRERILALGIGVSHLSGGVQTGVGAYAGASAAGSGQFEICDDRSLEEIARQCVKLGYEPLYR